MESSEGFFVAHLGSLYVRMGLYLGENLLMQVPRKSGVLSEKNPIRSWKRPPSSGRSVGGSKDQ